MIPSQMLQSILIDSRNYMKCPLILLNSKGFMMESSMPEEEVPAGIVDGFLNSDADIQEAAGFYMVKVYDAGQVEYVLAGKTNTDHVIMTMKFVASQIQNLLNAYRDKLDKHAFIQNLLLDNMLPVDAYNRAKKLHVNIEAKRIVFIIETKYDKDSGALETVRSIFASKPKDFVTAIDEKNIIVVKELAGKDDYEKVQQIALMLVDMLNTEAMTSVRVSYGTIIHKIMDVSRSYKEAKLAIEVGKIFYAENRIMPYNCLGIGRLIYQLPLPLCKMFMEEVFGERLPDEFDEETITTINKFFENSLNISETARQLYVHRNTLVYRLEKLQKSTGLDIRVFDDALTFKIAMMVVSYMKYLEQ